MKFGLRLIGAGLAALVAGGMFVSDSFEKPLEGMEPTPIWKGALVLMLGVGLIGFGIRYIVGENRKSAPEASDAEQSEEFDSK